MAGNGKGQTCSLRLRNMKYWIRSCVGLQMRRSPVAVARSSTGGVTIRYVLPILWMTSRFAVMGRMAIGDAWKVEPQPTTAPWGGV